MMLGYVRTGIRMKLGLELQLTDNE